VRYIVHPPSHSRPLTILSKQLKYVRGMFRSSKDGPTEGRVRLDYGKAEDVAIVGIGFICSEKLTVTGH